MDTQVTVWEPTEAELDGAQYRAAGYSPRKIAQLLGKPASTVARWDANPEYRAFVGRLRRDLMENLEPKLAAVMDSALNIMLEVFNGNIRGNDPRAELAQKVLRDTAFKLVEAKVGGRGRGYREELEP